MKRICILLFMWFCLSVQGAYAEPIIADHNAVNDFDNIPAEYIAKVKEMLFVVAGESHGGGYHYGLRLLAQADPTYAVNANMSNDPPETHSNGSLRSSQSFRFGTDWLRWGGEEDFWTNTAAKENIKTGLTYMADNYEGPVVFAFGWCWDMTSTNATGSRDPETRNRWGGSTKGGPDGDSLRWGIDEHDYTETGNRLSLQNYLEAVDEYNDHESEVYTIFTTGPVDEKSMGELNYQRYLKHDAIRKYAQNTDGILFDFADILCWNNQNVQHTTSWDTPEGLTITFQVGDPDLAPTDGKGYEYTHIPEEGLIRLAKATWWMLARIAGWDGGTGQPAADYTVNPETGDLSLDFEFDASSSSDSDGTIAGYAWDFGDGTTDTGMMVSHKFETTGEFSVELTVTDDDGNTDSETKTIVVTDQQPGTLAFSEITYDVLENESSVTITINRINGSDGDVSVDFETLDDTAEAGTDYLQTSGTLTWSDGDTAPKSFSIDILDDDDMEGNQTLMINLFDAVGTTISGTNPATLSIQDDDLNEDQSLVLRYTFDEGSGSTITDSSQVGNDHSVSQMLAGETDWVTNGKIGNAFNFESGVCFIVPNSEDLNFDPQSEEFTVSVWINSASYAYRSILKSPINFRSIPGMRTIG